ncbi:SDR family oxidoreductase [Micromonospora sp. WMMD812]|uniref:SDR family oxidoreductase n=1 Tax=Micromonospora sp. WMMD812 TaxID=3015152 RepID=UPI00248ACC0D|nr:SDR family oxidoreductase [Micromonospora sp. WMMD812]WBB70102.1 SDR family oxidoreductase [Micromonospora sp. WMMD812]
MQIRGRAALVTGANRGIGRAFARELVEHGAVVYGAARRPELITDAGVVPIRLDVTDPATIAEATETIGDLSILVNNAGTGFAGSVLAGSLENARREMEVNYFGTWAVTQAFAPTLARNGGGAVINMLSAASWLALQQAAGYAASKAAQWSLSNAMRLALREQGTHVLGVHVGYVDTDLSAGVDLPKISPEEVARAAIKAVVSDEEEVLVDEFSRQIKSALPNDIAELYLAR